MAKHTLPYMATPVLRNGLPNMVMSSVFLSFLLWCCYKGVLSRHRKKYKDPYI